MEFWAPRVFYKHKGFEKEIERKKRGRKKIPGQTEGSSGER